MDFKTFVLHNSVLSSGQPALKGLLTILHKLMNDVDLLYALEYEALGLNPVFLDSSPERGRRLEGERQSRAAVCTALRGSSLWLSENTSLSGAISMKSGCAVHGAVRDALTEFEGWVKDYDKTPESHYTKMGIVITLDMMNVSMAHLSRLITNRLMRLTNSAFPGFLGLEEQDSACSELRSRVSGIDAAIGHLSAPCGLYSPTAVNSAKELAGEYYNGLSAALSITELLYILLAMEAYCCLKLFEQSFTVPDGALTSVIYEKIKHCAENVSWETLLQEDTLCRLIRLLETISFDAGGE